jgi:MoxR-like ATPase
MVVATQNPFEFEGTYYLPENQLDRFLLRIKLGYPDRAAEQQILAVQPSRNRLDQLSPVLSANDVIELQDQVPLVRLEHGLLDYILDIVQATREHESLHLGVSPRGALALSAACQASALLNGRDYVVPDDIKHLAISVFAHRVIGKTYLSNGDDNTTTKILQQILDQVPAPR